MPDTEQGPDRRQPAAVPAITPSLPPELNALLAPVVELMPEAVIVTRLDGTIVYVNPAFERMTGYRAADVLGQTPRILNSGRQDQAFYVEMWNHILAGDAFHAELVNRRKDGTLYVQEMTITPVRGSASTGDYFVCLAHDVTERHTAHERVRLLESAARAIGEAPSLEEAFASVIRLVCEVTGWVYGEAWEAAGLPFLRCTAAWHAGDTTLAEFRALSDRLRLEVGSGVPGRVWQSATPEWHPDVTRLGAGFARARAAVRAGLHAGFGVPIISDGEVLAVLAFFAGGVRDDERDMIDLVSAIGANLGTLVRRRRAERAAAEERSRLAVTLRSIGDGVITTDAQGRVDTLNPVAEELTGWSAADARGRQLLDVFHIINEHTRHVCENPVERVLATGHVVGLANHTALIARDGAERVIADSAAPIRDDDGSTKGVVLVFHDETANRRHEAELQRANKLESLGVLAGGIAHDFNNALTAIIAHIGLAKQELDARSETYSKLADAEQACLRAASLTRQLLTFSRGGMPLRKPAAIEPLVRETASFAVTGSTSRLEFSFAPELPTVEIDEGQVSQVVHNLVLNALQAMTVPGVITVIGEQVPVGPGGIEGLPLEPGSYVRISVRDSGPGIPPDLLARVFDPYFTTKETGSGLGLAAAYSVIRNHEGHVTVESRPGIGATFRVYLPAMAARRVRPAAAPSNPEARGHAILFMDDEETIRRAMGEVLARLGHEVVLCRDGEEAVARYQERLAATGKGFGVVLLDLTVPGAMGGHEALQRIRALDPAVVAIASSGYSNDAVMSDFRRHGFAGAIAKPYTRAELQAALDEVLAARA